MFKKFKIFILKVWKYGGVEYAYRAAFPTKKPEDAKVIGEELAKLTHIFAGSAALCAFVYFFYDVDLSTATWFDYLSALKEVVIVFTLVSLFPRVILMIPMIANMHIKRPKMFYIVMIISLLTSFAVFRLTT